VRAVQFLTDRPQLALFELVDLDPPPAVRGADDGLNAHSRNSRPPYDHALSVVQLGEAYLLADQVDNASACADRAMTLARGRGERGNEARTLHLLGEIASHHAGPDLTTAAGHYGAAMSLASELGMRPLVAHCHLGLGRLYRRARKRAQAQHHLTTATAMYREMGMTYWLEKVEAFTRFRRAGRATRKAG
jgi:tetratricopeptide (TPR) repeat protein